MNGVFEIRSAADADHWRQVVLGHADTVAAAIKSHAGQGIGLLRAMKFEQIGIHPIYGNPLNLIEQVNQTFSYLVAIEAARFLLDRHPHAGGFKLAPGAHAALECDVMSIKLGVVAAETFAAVLRTNNRKMVNDIRKLGPSPAMHRYVFFTDAACRHRSVEYDSTVDGVEVWTVDVGGTADLAFAAEVPVAIHPIPIIEV